MATEFNTQVGNGKHCLRFETDNREYYLLMQETARRRVDGKPVTNADRIRAMSDEELAEFIRSMVDGSYNYDFACYKYTNYATHHSDPANKVIYLYKCDDCESGGFGLDVLMWLQQPAEEGDND